jgi:hypothetical protein
MSDGNGEGLWSSRPSRSWLALPLRRRVRWGEPLPVVAAEARCSLRLVESGRFDSGCRCSGRNNAVS